MTAVAQEAHDAPAEAGKALTVQDPPRRPLQLLRPIAAPAELIVAQEEMRAMITAALKPGRDFGTVPGIDKPFLMKAGAERVAVGMGCYFGEPRIVEKEIDHDRKVTWTKRKKKWEKGEHVGWTEDSGESQGLYRYVIAVPVINRATGEVVGEGIGSCSTMESKYIHSPRDSENTALKMAHKRALVGATLVTFGLSDQFTQDVEDIPADARGGSAARASTEPEAKCPKCGGKMWDNRAKKASGEFKSNAPDFGCKDKKCDGKLWPGQFPPKPEKEAEAAPVAGSSPAVEMVEPHRLEGLMPFGPAKGKPIAEQSEKELRAAIKWVNEDPKRETRWPWFIEAAGEAITNKTTTDKPAKAKKKPEPAAVASETFEDYPGALEEEDDDAFSF